jgi:outer membrane protein OmpA-like peptidoglycan-associated protein
MRRALSVVAAAVVVGACASTQKPGTLTQAEQLYATLDSTGAERRVEGDMIRAKATIDTAQTGVAQAQGQEYVNGMSAVALRTVQIAQQNDQRVQAQRAADSLHEARLTKQLALAHVQQKSLEAQNAVANARADSLRKAADAANAQLGKAMAQLQSLVTEITNLKETSRGLVISLSDILFDVGKATLKPGAEASVRKISAVLQQYPNHQISVEGYTDSQGSDTFNQKLSEDRANSVKQILIGGGVDPVLISSKGFGKAKPVASNDTPEGRQANRRVEIVVEGAGTLGDQVEKPAGVAGGAGAAPAATSPAATSPAATSPAATSPAAPSPAPSVPAATTPAAPSSTAPVTPSTDSTPAPSPTVFKKDTTRTSAPATDTTHHP